MLPRLVLAVLLSLCATASPALAEPVLVVGHGTAAFQDDPALPPDAMRAPPEAGERACATATAAAAGPTVRGTLARVERARAITPEQHDEWLATYQRARAAASRMRSGRSGELRAVVAGVESLARRHLLTSTRLPAAFLQLQRNAEFWPTRSFPKAPQPERKPCTGAAGLGGARVEFEGDPVVFQWYPGQGLQIQPLANFGKANALWRACQPPAEPPQPGAEPPPPCRPEDLRALLDRMIALASHRGGFTAWEYFFAFGGGAPPWISGLAQGTAIQALTRGSQLLGDPKYVEFARGALGAFEQRPPLGVRAASTSGTGRHYLIYSFSSGLRVLNGFLQSLVGLYDFADATKDPRATRLFKTGDRAARREIPRYDTGAWSLYSSGGAESDLGYHRLVRDFLQSLCDRTKAGAYCGRAKRFDRYLHERTRVGFGAVGAVRLGADANVRFTLSKLSCVTLRVRRGGKLVHVRKLVMPRGLRGLTYHPTRAGRYRVEVQAVDLLNHYTRVERPLTVRPRRRG
ncbi:MAG: D-glucuronyl C5-epimerase family protein [Solirubrobacteraceae bacterium]